MKWFDKWFLKKYIQASSNMHASPTKEALLSNRHNMETEKTLTLNITKANGGWVIEHRQYDKHKDNFNNGLHIITEDKDLGEEIGKIISFVSLYR